MMIAFRIPLVGFALLLCSIAVGQPNTRLQMEVTPAAPLPTARMNHWQLKMPDGRVAAIGGHWTGFVSLATADIYDPATNS